MESIIIEPSNDKFYIPHVEFNVETGYCLIEGESFLEDTYRFYSRLNDWVDAYFSEGKKTLDFNMKFAYFNTSSSKAVLELLLKLKKHIDRGHEITVKWHYPEPDHNDMLEEGEDFADDTDLAIEFVPYEEEE